MSWKVQVTGKVKRFLKKLNKTEKEKILKVLMNLEREPFPRTYNICKLRGLKNAFRMVIGDFRICYFVAKEEREIIIFLIGRRGKVYKKLR